MNIYVINMILTIMWGFLLTRDESKSKKKLFIILVSIQMVLISGLRDISIGADTWNYENHFYELNNLDLYSWRNLFLNLISFSGDYNSRDMGYEIFTKLFGEIIPSFRVFLFAIAIFVCIGLGRFLYRHSFDLCMSYVLFEAFMLQFMLLTGIRQTIAICLVVFWGYDLIQGKKLVKYIMLCIFAMLFHFTAIVALPFYFICNYKREIKCKYVAVFVITLAIFVFKGIIFSILPLGMYTQYSQSTGIQSYTFVILMVMITVALFLLDSKGYLVKHKREEESLVVGTLIAELFTSSSIVLDILFRLSHYYIFYMISYFPRLFDCLEESSKRFAKIMFYLLMIVYICLRKDGYSFFF